MHGIPLNKEDMGNGFKPCRKECVAGTSQLIQWIDKAILLIFTQLVWMWICVL